MISFLSGASSRGNSSLNSKTRKPTLLYPRKDSAKKSKFNSNPSVALIKRPHYYTLEKTLPKKSKFKSSPSIALIKKPHCYTLEKTLPNKANSILVPV
jgi:hypothetical protein